MQILHSRDSSHGANHTEQASLGSLHRNTRRFHSHREYQLTSLFRTRRYKKHKKTALTRPTQTVAENDFWSLTLRM